MGTVTLYSKESNIEHQKFTLATPVIHNTGIIGKNPVLYWDKGEHVDGYMIWETK